MNNKDNNHENDINPQDVSQDLSHIEDQINPNNGPMGEWISELSMMAMQRKDGGLDLSKFSTEQVDKLLETAAKNEENAYNYHSKKLDVYQNLETKRINASIVGERTSRIVNIAILVTLAIITLIIVLWKNEFFIPWITFVTGSLGGFGIGKAQSNKKQESQSSDFLDDNE